MKKIFILPLIIVTIVAFSSCYRNYYDVTDATLASINNVSFRNDVVPIMTSGACGCHNNENANDTSKRKQIPFSNPKTSEIFYSAIQSRSTILNTMANGGLHPGEGSIFFTPSQAAIVKAWVAQGAKDDYTPPPITGNITYLTNIVPIYRTDCKGGSCHGGLAVALDINVMIAKQTELKAMMSSLGATGHPGGPISVAPLSAATFLAWIAQGLKN